MQFPDLHDWDLTTSEARDLQLELAANVITDRPLGPCKLVAAADCSFERFGAEIHAAVVIVDLASMDLIESVAVTRPLTFPYVPGLLSFREAPAILDAFRQLRSEPDAILVDGQGTAHPRRMGIACHLGLWLERPTIGCAKSVLCGAFDEPGTDRGSTSPMIDKGEVIGQAVRTRSRVKPVYVSAGHLCDLEGASRLILETSSRYRLPIPARLAHLAVNAARIAARPGDPSAT